MTIDPILPLSVSIAEGRGTYAIFLGSGASKEAGIPTGNDILWDTVNLLYKLENEIETIDNEENVEKWFNESKYKDFNYSDILENLCPTREERRRFLEKYFIDKKPSESHFLIADLVKNGLIKVILTTNFDRLMENALETKGIHPTIVSSEEELKTSLSREHSDCWILKLHGDYKRLNIRNTSKELEKLDDDIEKEFQDVLNKYGILVMGYSGSDEGVMSCFEKRDSKYTLYWLTREKTQDNVNELINQQDGREIKRDTAEEFIKELSSKIAIFQAHKTGETPEFIMNKIKDYIRKNDIVGLYESLKKQMEIIRTNWYKIYEKAEIEFREKSGNKDNAFKSLLEYFKEFEEYCNIIAAIGLVLIEYSNDSFKDLLKLFQKIYDLSFEIREERNLSSWHSPVLSMPEGIIHNIYYCLGAYALKEGKFEELGQLLSMNIIIRYDSNIVNRPILLSYIFHPETFDSTPSKAFRFLKESYNDKDFLKEYFHSENDFFISLCQFNLIMSLYGAKLQISNPSNDYYNVYPNFARYSGIFNDKVRLILSRMRIQRDFLFGLSMQAFGEIDDLFIEEYPERCSKVNSIIRDNRSHVHMAFNELPCNLFNKE